MINVSKNLVNLTKKAKKTLPEMKKEIQKKSTTKKNGGNNVRVKYEYEIMDDDQILRQEITDKSDPEVGENERASAAAAALATGD